MNIQEIKSAVDAGKTVKWANAGYDVIKDSLGQYLIVYAPSGHCIGLHGLEGTEYANRLNAAESDFYIAE
jgi:hypothetical protein